ncbi:MazG family protein [Prochlorococcus marinus]|uniref:MazG family protein n=1 Tax=Prochlorococcus marinus TaxID=1219 RepID=UPI0022B59C9F|nr:MazG family protein [Prochlorococcus marinus]
MQTTSQNPIEALIEVVSKLRDPIHGCPWDIKQNHRTLIPYAIEEAHEVADAIKNGTDQEICDELGDLLLQVVMHAQIAKEEQRFSFDDIARAAQKKMMRRHPQIFNAKSKSIKMKKTWDEIKQSEKSYNETNHPFADYIKNKLRIQSAFNGAIYISKKIQKKFLNDNSVNDTLVKEFDVFERKLAKGNKIDSQIKIGRLLFKLINIGIDYGIDIEDSLDTTNKKMIQGLGLIESELGMEKIKKDHN